MYACNAVRDVCTWDTVALQWKQHLFAKLGLYLPVEDYRKVSDINHRVREVFGRRFSNLEENYVPRKHEQRIVVVTPVFNAGTYIERCIKSVITQDYSNWQLIIIDDCSTDRTAEIASKYVCDNVKLIQRTENKGAVFNQVTTIKQFCNPNDIVMLLDGDDALVPNNQIFQKYNNWYDGSTEFTYGSCWSEADSIPLVAQHYPKAVLESRSYRKHKFNWNMPYTHLRTFRAELLQIVDDGKFKDEKGNWYKAGGDGSVFYEAIENVDPSKVKAIPDIMVLYNDKNPLNDYKINSQEQTNTANRILAK